MKRFTLLIKYKNLYLTFLGALLCQMTFAQQSRQIQGIVTSATDGNPLPGVTVILKGTNIGTTTEANGKYSLTINKNSNTLRFSFLGYITKDIPIGSRTIINATLQLSSTQLNELVVTGYTTQKKVDLTGAVDVVNVGNMVKQPRQDVATLLQGQAPGVSVISSGQPGVAPQISIRGINTFGNNTPLFIVDEVPTQDISNLSPDDIGSIQVLKDAGAASIYGSRASNGVVIITTKIGKGKVSVHYDSYFGMQYPKPGNVYHKLNPIQDAQLRWDAFHNSGVTNISDPLYGNGTEPALPDYLSPEGAMDGDPATNPALYNLNTTFSPDQFASFYQITKANKQGTDWYHEIMKPAPLTSHSISIAGGGDRGNFFLGLNYSDQNGLLIYTFSRRYAIRANTDFAVSNHIHVGENLEYSFITGRQLTGNGDQTNAIRNAATTPEIIPVFDIKGNFGGAHSTYLFGDNPVAWQVRTRNNKQTNTRLFGNAFVNIDFLKYFTFHSSFGVDINSGLARSFNYPAYEGYLPPSPSSYSEGSTFDNNWLITNTLTFKNHFGPKASSNLSVLIGTESVNESTEDVGGTTQNYFSFDPNYTTLSTGSGTVINYSGRSSDGLISQFAKVDYSYKEQYLLSGTIRRDGSSKFINQQYGWFPAISAAWRISQERFLANVSWLTDLKIRGSWGIMGNQLNVNPNNGYSTFISNKSGSYYDLYGTNNSLVMGFQAGQIGNPNAKWEKDINSDIGVDATLFNGQLGFTADYYYKNIKDLLYNPQLLGTAGGGAVPFVNIARVRNNGVDFSINGNVKITNNLHFTGALSFTSYNNVILKVSNQQNYFWTNDTRRFGTSFIRNQVGHPIGAFYGYKIIGFWNSTSEIQQADATAQKVTGNPSAAYQVDEGLGRFRYADVNNDGQITPNDRTFLGNPNPKFSYGLNIGLTYKNFDFSTFLYGVQGNQIWDNLLWWLDFFPSFNTGKSLTALYDSWTPTNHNAKAPIQEDLGYQSTNGAPNSYYIKNGSYLRDQNLVIGYTFPSSLVGRLSIQKLRIYLQTANLFTITKYPGVDPELSGTTADFGIDGGSNAYPHSKEFLVGINLDF